MVTRLESEARSPKAKTSGSGGKNQLAKRSVAPTCRVRLTPKVTPLASPRLRPSVAMLALLEPTNVISDCGARERKLSLTTTSPAEIPDQSSNFGPYKK